MRARERTSIACLIIVSDYTQGLMSAALEQHFNNPKLCCVAKGRTACEGSGVCVWGGRADFFDGIWREHLALALTEGGILELVHEAVNPFRAGSMDNRRAPENFAWS